ncbi:hypothetical protein Sste5346_004490 [Sporothrix stenoceras]|uniref:Uncharacterized protein n=1 Tax=Sporothrix stenoceras TaxID=5173 RepID=A0ABR3Z865_9PEZI
MEPPAKRTRVGRAPHDAPADDNNVDIGNRMSSNKGKKSSNAASSKPKNGEDEDDEIAMDPEDYAMKVDPEYRLDRNRANADNKLKSAFELLFEKYSQDFGDTGDEINFYTDEIEVDNGHIASLPVERPSKQDDQDSDEESDEGGGETDKLPALSAAAKAASSRLVASLLPSRFGPGGTVIMGGGSSAARGLAPGEVDPTWAAPELPDSAFTTPGGGFPFIPPPPPPPPRTSYVAPQPTVFTKALPTSYGEDLGEDGEDEEDDLIMDTPNPMMKESRGENSSPSSAAPKAPEEQPTKSRRKRTSSRPSTADDATETADIPAAPKPSASKKRKSVRNGEKPAPPTEKTVVPDSQSSGLDLSEMQSSAPLPVSFEEEISQDGPSSPAAQGSLPTPPDEDVKSEEQPASKEPNTDSTKPKSKVTFKQNKVDPSFVFSDEEDFGLKKRKRKQPTSTVPAIPVAEPAEEVPVAENEVVQPTPSLDEGKSPLAAPVFEKKEQKRRGRPRKSNGTEAVPATIQTASEVIESYDLPEAQRRDAQSLSIIIMTSSRPSSALPTPALAEAAPPVDIESGPETTAEPKVESVPEPEPEPEAEPESEPTAPPVSEPIEPPAATEPEPRTTPEPANEPKDEAVIEPGLETEQDVEMDDSTYAPSPPEETSEEQPKKRKRRRQTEEQSSPLPSSQKAAKSARSLKSSQKSASSFTKSKAGRHRTTREIPDSQSIGSSGIISLVSDGSADEAEIEKIAESSPRPFVPGSGGRQPVSVSVSTSVSGSRRGSPQTTPTSRSHQTTPSSRRRLTAAEVLMATPSRHRSYNKAGRLTPTANRLLLLSPLARRHPQMSGTSSAASSPGGSPVQTPGGTIRRCGKDGFRCEREFCFRCT